MKSLCAVSIQTPVPGFPGLAVVTSEVEAKSHSLVDALDAIPQDVRQRLEREYESTYRGPALRDVLTTYQGLFAISRYPFEKIRKGKGLEEYGIGPLMQLCTFLRRFVGEMEPVTRIRW